MKDEDFLAAMKAKDPGLVDYVVRRVTDPETHMQTRILDRLAILQAEHVTAMQRGRNKAERREAELKWLAVESAIGEVRMLRATGDWRV